MRITLIILFLCFNSVLIAQELKTISANQANDSDFFDYEDYDENMNLMNCKLKTCIINGSGLQ
jgi:hypothetical protein